MSSFLVHIILKVLEICPEVLVVLEALQIIEEWTIDLSGCLRSLSALLVKDTALHSFSARGVFDNMILLRVLVQTQSPQVLRSKSGADPGSFKQEGG